VTSDRKIAANRANAKKSTGARTKEGESTSSQNAYKHGIWAKQLTIADDEREDYEKLVGDLSALLKPEGPILQYYFDEIVVCMWRLRMLVPIESRQLLPRSEDAKSPEHLDVGLKNQDFATQAAVLEELRKRVQDDEILTGEMRHGVLTCCGEDFTAVVDKFYDVKGAYTRRLATDVEQKAIRYGMPPVLDIANKMRRDAGLVESEQGPERVSTEEEISRKQEEQAVQKEKRILLTFIVQARDLAQLRQLQSHLKLQQADSVLVRFDLQLRYRAALTRDLRKAIEAFLHYNRSLRPGKKA
jgi:hypothetical protein